ncbi:MAG: DUF4249 domain-containing protein [Azospira oryzae]|nr:MAG: DUF4249 domain-containing protein [Azospira oryzae]
MIKKIIQPALLFVLLLFVAGCIDPYRAPAEKSNADLLVIDGFLNSTAGTASVKLSKTIPVSLSSGYRSEKNAIVSIEDENGTVFNLPQKDTGVYESSNMNIGFSQKYQLHIKTTSGKEYRSDFIELKQTPPLDNITWKPSADGITLYANTHDPNQKTHYYQWMFTETWEYNADLYSVYKMVNGEPKPRTAAEDVYVCWRSAPSTQILINSTMRLSSDVVSDFPLTFIEKGSKKISRTYSMLLQQRGLTEEAYNYWDQLKKTTENLGGLFDPLPYQLLSNVHNINDSSEPVLGYFYGGGVEEKRIFIRFYELPDYLLFIPRSSCVQDTLYIKDLSRYNSTSLLTSAVGQPIPIAYLITSKSCADCTTQGGSLTKPDFWPR